MKPTERRPHTPLVPLPEPGPLTTKGPARVAGRPTPLVMDTGETSTPAAPAGPAPRAPVVRPPIYGLATPEAIGAWERREVEFLSPLLRQGESTVEGVDERVQDVEEDDLRDRLHGLTEQIARYRELKAGHPLRAAFDRATRRLERLLSAASESAARAHVHDLVRVERIEKFAHEVLERDVKSDRVLDSAEHQVAWSIALDWKLTEADFREAIRYLEATGGSPIEVQPRPGLDIFFLERSFPTLEALRGGIEGEEPYAFTKTVQDLEKRRLSNRLEALSRSATLQQQERKHLGALVEQVEDIEKRYAHPLAPYSLLFALGHRAIRVSERSFQSLTDLVDSDIEPHALAPLVSSGLLALWAGEVAERRDLAGILMDSVGRTPTGRAARFLFAAGRHTYQLAGLGKFSNVGDLTRLACGSLRAWDALVKALQESILPDYLTATSPDFRAHFHAPAKDNSTAWQMAYAVAGIGGARTVPIFVDPNTPAVPLTPALGRQLIMTDQVTPLVDALKGGALPVYFGTTVPPHGRITPRRCAVRFLAHTGETAVVLPPYLGQPGTVVSFDNTLLDLGLSNPPRLLEYIAEGLLFEWAAARDESLANLFAPQGDCTLPFHALLWWLGFRGVVTGATTPGRSKVYDDARKLVTESNRSEVDELVVSGVLAAWFMRFDPDSAQAMELNNASRPSTAGTDWIADRALDLLGAAVPEVEIFGPMNVQVRAGGRTRGSVTIAHTGNSTAALRLGLCFGTSPEHVAPYSIVIRAPSGHLLSEDWIECNVDSNQSANLAFDVDLPIGASAEQAVVELHVVDLDRPSRRWTISTALERDNAWSLVALSAIGLALVGTVTFITIYGMKEVPYLMGGFTFLGLLGASLMLGVPQTLNTGRALPGRLVLGFIIVSCISVGLFDKLVRWSFIDPVTVLASALSPLAAVNGWGVIGALTGLVAGCSWGASRYLNGPLGWFVAATTVPVAYLILRVAI